MKKFALIIALAIACPSLASQTASTPTNTPTLSSQQSPEQFANNFDELLKSPKYSKTHESQEWVRDKEDKDVPQFDEPTDTSQLEKWLERLHEFSLMLGQAGKVILILLLVAFFVWLYLKFADRLPTFLNKKTKRHTTISLSERILEAELFGDLPEHSELYNTAKSLFDKDKLTACASLLYRGMLRVHNVAYDLPINKSQTERQCQALLDKADNARADERAFFVALIELWQQLAYGQRKELEFKAETLAVLDKFNKLYPADFYDKLINDKGADDGKN